MTDSAHGSSRRSATMHDVAALAGVSQATVSLVLNDSNGSRFSDQTKKRVREAAARLGYRTNAFAKSLRKGESGMIGFVSDEVATSPFAGKLLKGAQERAWAAGHVIISVDTFGEAGLEQAAIEMMQSYRVRGIVYAAMYHRRITVPALLADTPTVVVNAQDDAGRVDSFFPDEELGGFTATQHLLEAGHTRIGMINIQPRDSTLPAGIGRLAGYRRALKEAGVQPDTDLVRYGDGIVESGQVLTTELMRGPDAPTAIFAANDRTAWGAYRALSALGLTVGVDCSVVGFDDMETVAQHLDPALTTLALPFEEMGRRAVDALLAPRSTPRQEALECPLISRQSVAKAKVPA
ncbi:LacI family DNA-binding transcriptional regulator [Knoellia sp. S7-12]|uniref:LacI family DNA-binding transcriptional regulator n=1 Tax=Knoellia sp. S7-12 TaxID=3126698 RepID=UPI003368F071